jgi:cytochrome c551/c552
LLQGKSPAAAGLLLLGLALCASIAFAQGDAKRGLYLSKAAGCVGCHTQVTKDP